MLHYIIHFTCGHLTDSICLLFDHDGHIRITYKSDPEGGLEKVLMLKQLGETITKYELCIRKEVDRRIYTISDNLSFLLNICDIMQSDRKVTVSK